ncbi:hypothetical protein DFAR_3370009 [Desulfarculales bacterium]
MPSLQRNNVVMPKVNNTAAQRGKTMVRVASLFSQLLHHFSRTEFVALVKEHDVEVRTKRFPCWTQLVAKLFCYLARADSLREICQGLSYCLGKLSHLGASAAPKKVHIVLRQPAQALVLVPSPVLQNYGALPCPRLPGQEKGQVQI